MGSSLLPDEWMSDKTNGYLVKGEYTIRVEEYPEN